MWSQLAVHEYADFLFDGEKEKISVCKSLVNHPCKSIHTEQLKKNGTRFSEEWVRFIMVGYVFDYENLIKYNDDII